MPPTIKTTFNIYMLVSSTPCIHSLGLFLFMKKAQRGWGKVSEDNINYLILEKFQNQLKFF